MIEAMAVPTMQLAGTECSAGCGGQQGDVPDGPMFAELLSAGLAAEGQVDADDQAAAPVIPVASDQLGSAPSDAAALLAVMLGAQVTPAQVEAQPVEVKPYGAQAVAAGVSGEVLAADVSTGEPAQAQVTPAMHVAAHVRASSPEEVAVQGYVPPDFSGETAPENTSTAAPKPGVQVAGRMPDGAPPQKVAFIAGQAVQPRSDTAPDRTPTSGEFGEVRLAVDTSKGAFLVSEVRAGSAQLRQQAAAPAQAIDSLPGAPAVDRVEPVVTAEPFGGGADAGAAFGDSTDARASGNTDTRVAAFTLPGTLGTEQPVAAAAAVRPETTPGPDTQLHQRIIDQVVREIALHRSPDRNDLVVKLNPPELGALRIHITQGAHGMTSRIEASSEQVRGLLQAHLPALTDALSSAGLRMDSVSVTSGLSFGTFMQSHAEHEAYQQGNHSRHRSAGPAGDIAAAAAINAAAAQRYEGAGYSWLA